MMNISLRLGENRVIESNELQINIVLEKYRKKTNISCITKSINSNSIRLDEIGFIELNKVINLKTFQNDEKIVFNLASINNFISKLGKIMVKIKEANKTYEFVTNYQFNDNYLDLVEIYNYKGEWKFKILILPCENIEEILKIPNYKFIEDDIFDYKSLAVEELKKYKECY